MKTQAKPVTIAESLKEVEVKKDTPSGIIDIPRISNSDMFDRNADRANEKGHEHCPCCGRSIENPKFFIRSIYGGMAYPASDEKEYGDAWVMGVGSECQKRFPSGYVFTK